MLKYEIVEIHDGEYVEIMKCIGESHIESIHSSDTVIVIIPGNPGLIEFYEQYALFLHDSTGLPVIGISHTGHIGVGYDKHWSKIADLNQQVTDKIKYIKEYIAKKDGTKLNLIFIGHSIGCHVILEMMDLLNKNSTHKRLNINVLKSILLFPTIEYMNKTPQGKRVTPMLNNFLICALCLSFLISLIPSSILKPVVTYILKHRKDPDCLDENVINTVFKMVKNYDCVKSILTMAKHEMNEVNEFKKMKDLFSSENYKNNILLYYGQSDHWCPVDFYWEMKDRIDASYPHLISNDIVTLDDYEMDHAFIIFKNQTMVMSKLTVEWIESCLQKVK